jgi:hypothetical protein
MPRERMRSWSIAANRPRGPVLDRALSYGDWPVERSITADAEMFALTWLCGLLSRCRTSLEIECAYHEHVNYRPKRKSYICCIRY